MSITTDVWVLSRDLIGAPGLPSSLSTIIRRASREGWVRRRRRSDRSTKGVEYEYLLSSLPEIIGEVVQARMAREVMAKSAGADAELPVVPSTGVKSREELVLMRQCPALVERKVNNLTEGQKKIADARMVLAQEVMRLMGTLNYTRKAAVEFVAVESKKGTLPERVQLAADTANARKGSTRRGVGKSSLQQWLSDYMATQHSGERLAIMAPGQPKKLQPDDCAWWIAFKTHYGTPTGDSIKATWRKFKNWWEEQYHDQPAVLAAMPSYDIVRRMLKKEPLYKRMQGRVSGSAAKVYDVYSKRDWSLMPVNGIWIADGKSLDMKVLHPVYNRPFTPELTLVIDGRTRVIVGWSLSLSENRFAVAEAYRHGMEKYGKPLFVYSDNGGGEKNNMLDADITGIFPRMGITHMTGIPGNPQARGIIERLNGVVPISLARRFATYNGRNVDPEHQRVMSKKMVSLTNALRQGKDLTTEQKRTLGLIPDWQALTVAIQEEIDAYNRSHEHSGLPKVNGKHLSPQAYRRHVLETEGDDIEYLTASELHDTFLPEETRTAARGWVQLGTNFYFARELIEVDQEKVRVAFNPLDANEVYIRRLDGTFVCTAIWNGNTNAPVPLARVEKALQERAQRQIKRGQAVIQDAKDSLRPAIEHKPDADFGLLTPPQPVEEEEEIYVFASQARFAAKKAGNY